jgi:hypothetical protein
LEVPRDKMDIRCIHSIIPSSTDQRLLARPSDFSCATSARETLRHISTVITNGNRKNGIYEPNKMRSWRFDNSPAVEGVLLKIEARLKMNVFDDPGRGAGDGICGLRRW